MFEGPYNEPQFYAGGAILEGSRCWLLIVPNSQGYWLDHALQGLLQLASQERQWVGSGETTAAEAAAVFSAILDNATVVDCP